MKTLDVDPGCFFKTKHGKIYMRITGAPTGLIYAVNRAGTLVFFMDTEEVEKVEFIGEWVRNVREG